MELIKEDFSSLGETVPEDALALIAKGGPRTLKLAEKRRAKAEKRLNKTRDETDKEKGKRYLKLLSLPVFITVTYVTR